MLRKIANFPKDNLLALTTSHPIEEKRWISHIWSAALFLGGALIWGYFFNWGDTPYNFHDWKDITIPRLVFVSNAMRQGVLPLHIADGFPLGGVTDRFLTIPDAYFSPQFLLLRWMGVGPFILLDFLLLYAVGFAGLVWIARRQRLSPLAFTALFLLFNFNGHLLAHFSVGHYTWTGYFFFPWLVGLVLAFLDGAGGWPWVLKISTVLLAMLLQGGYHQYVYALFLLAMLIPLAPRRFATPALALVFAVLLAAFRLAPPVLGLGKFDTNYTGGYPFLGTIIYAFTNVYGVNDFTTNLNLTQQIGTWEYAFYVGIIGVLFLAWFGFVSGFRSRQRPGSYAALLIPVIGLTVLSLDRVYRYLRALIPLPPITGERVPARILSLAFVLLLVLAVIELQHWLDQPKQRRALVVTTCAGAALIMLNDLWENLRLWRITEAANTFTAKDIDPSRWAVANHPDPLYLTVLIASGAVSVLALLALIGLRYQVFRRAALVQKHEAADPSFSHLH